MKRNYVNYIFKFNLYFHQRLRERVFVMTQRVSVITYIYHQTLNFNKKSLIDSLNNSCSSNMNFTLIGKTYISTPQS